MSAGTVSTAREPSVRVGLDVDGLGEARAKANVAFDMFLDLDDKNASSATAAAYEIMIWIGQVGKPYPLGFDEKNSACYTQQLGSFNL